MDEVQRAGLALERYETPATLAGALELLARHGARARLVAGATALLASWGRRRPPREEVLVDVTRIPGLSDVREGPDGTIHLGPLVTHAQVVRSELLVTKALPLAQACLEVGSPQVRARGTLAGALASGAPGGDPHPALAALGARVLLRSLRGERSVPAADLRPAGGVSLLPDEMIVDLALPPPEAAARRGLFVKLRARRGQSLAIANLAVVLDLSEDGRLAGARLVLGSVAPGPFLAAAASARLLGSRLEALGEGTIAEVARLAAEATAPRDDVHASAGYRREMVAVMTKRALRALREGAERSQWPARPVTLWGSARDGRSPTGAGSGAGHGAATPIRATVNGRRVEAPGATTQTLLEWLREAAGLTGTKSGCGEGVCGACTVQLDGVAVLACLVPAARAHGSEVRTVEGLARAAGPHPQQEAFVASGAVQCGFCTPGFLMAGASLLEGGGAPTRDEIEAAYAGNLCRCTGYHAIASAVRRAAAGDGAGGDRDV
jgi:xanthine dehydrogenase iron-sulfur cluster and FAD-binding subunit A